MKSITWPLVLLLGLLRATAWAQPYVPAPVSAQANEALLLYRGACLAEDFDERVCAKAVRQLEAIAREDPRQLDVQLALGVTLWNQSALEPEGSAERARLRKRSLDLCQQLVDLGLPDARPYYALGVVTRDADTRFGLMQRAAQLDPKHPMAHEDLAWMLVDRGQVDEAVKEYLVHLGVGPHEGRETALKDLRFAQRLAGLGRVREAARVLDAGWEALREEGNAERCLVFRSVDLDPYERVGARFAQRVRELRGVCESLKELERALSLEQRGQADGALQALERLVLQHPLPAEPYLALERLYRERGETARAAQAVTLYFQQEQDAAERCQRFRLLPLPTAVALAPELLQSLQRGCGP